MKSSHVWHATVAHFHGVAVTHFMDQVVRKKVLVYKPEELPYDVVLNAFTERWVKPHNTTFSGVLTCMRSMILRSHLDTHSSAKPWCKQMKPSQIPLDCTTGRIDDVQSRGICEGFICLHQGLAEEWVSS